ncbi:MAG: bifunctional demethylmenaquinone methyltransferase/2-methoxy-6-polyprenyl-1,4-benzoquinol methylase UbiE [Holophagales bacterium]|nr:bifunctional demethylmenaquinone methyltransferase/2-methoxy-6-polyprenyl-1,4-benzoquinol methylase UbiE [Holophagales bacterium]
MSTSERAFEPTGLPAGDDPAPGAPRPTAADGERERPGSGAMFDRIAGRYDLLNRIMSFGLDSAWRRATVRALRLRPGSRVLDIATGTAAMALEVLRLQPGATAVGLDPSDGMLELGRTKVEKRGLRSSIELLRGEAEELPFDDASFDAVCIAYGIRNVADRPRALREIARVTRPGGRVAILEATEAEGGFLALGARLYVHHVVPRLGALLSRAPEYRYLQSSIQAFPPPDDFVALMEASGLEVLESRSLTLGANRIFVAVPRVSPPADGNASAGAARSDSSGSAAGSPAGGGIEGGGR